MKALNPKQIQTAQLLAGGATITATAEQLEITRTTIHDWLKNDFTFQAHLNSLKREVIEAGRLSLQSSVALAVDTINSIMTSSENDLARLKAAHDILDRAGINKPQSIGSDDAEKLKKQYDLEKYLELDF